jgi:hypothetical protein
VLSTEWACNEEILLFTPLELSDLTVCLSLLGFLFEILALISGMFSLSQTNFDLHPSLLPIETQHGQSQPFASSLLKHPENLDLIKQKLPGALGIMG